MLNLLDLRPVRMRDFKMTDQTGDGKITILIPKFGKGKIGQWFMKRLKHPYFIVNLDDFGSHVWSLCDGNKQVKDIAGSLKERFGEKVDPVYDRLSLFLTQMERARLIAFKETSKKELIPTSLKS